METLATASFCFHLPFPSKILPNSQIHQLPFSPSPSSYSTNKSSFNLYATTSTTVSNDFLGYPFEEETDVGKKDEKFDWFSQWYPIMPVADLDKTAPHGKKVMGLDIVVWWDKNENAWKVFDDMCPHRLAPLSEGRIDQWGRLQCVYHGWCFGGSGDCKFIPQAPRDGPPIHKSNKACVAVYPSTVQNGIVWFWPSTDLTIRISSWRRNLHISQNWTTPHMLGQWEAEIYLMGMKY